MILAHRQRGAAAVFAAIAMVAAITAFSLVFHMAQLYGAKRDLQRLANMAALDAAMIVGGCAEGQISAAEANAIAQVQRTLERNAGTEAQGWLTQGELVVGTVETDGGLRRVAAGAAEESPRAVRVTLNRPSPALLTRAFGEGAAAGSRIVASASAVAGPEVVLGVGSFTSRVQTSDETTLNNLYTGFTGGGSSLELSVAGYQGLFDAQVTIGSLARAAAGSSSATPEEFLTTEVEFGLGDLLQAIYDAASGQLDPAADGALRTIIDAAAPTLDVLPSQIIEIAGDPNQIDDALLFNVGELVNVAVMAANSVVPVDLAPVLDIPGLARLVPSIQILDPGEITVTGELTEDAEGFGGSGTSAQVVVNAQLSLLDSGGGALLEADISAGAVQGEASIVDIECARPGTPFHRVRVDAATSLASIDLSNVRINLPVIGTITLGGTTVDVSNRTETPLVFGGPDQTFPETQSAPAVSQNLGTAVTDALAGLVSDAVLPPALPVVQPLIDAALAQVFAQLANPALDEALQSGFGTLGMQVAGADVTVQSVRVERPRLVTHEEG